jgi:hypothetical protein
MAEKAAEPHDTVSRIHSKLIDCRKIEDIADPLREIGETVTWLRAILEHSLKESVYRDIYSQVGAKLPLPIVSSLLAEDIIRSSGWAGAERPVARDVTREQLRAVQAAVHALDGAAWAVQAAAAALKDNG